MRNHFGDEDVLDGELPEFEDAPRTRFRRRRDVAAATLIAVVAVVAGLLVWRSSDLRATTSTTYTAPVTSPARPDRFPFSLGEAWRANSPATPVPVVAGPTLVTGEGGEVVGRDPLTGERRWHYERDLPLCTVGAAWTVAIAVYARTANALPAQDSRKAGGCSEVTAFDPATGERGRGERPDENRTKPDLGQRNSDAELGTRLLFDDTYVTTTGDRLLTTWRSDLVQTMEYGQVPALVNPDKQPRTGCTFGTVAVDEGRIAVIERCPEDPTDRLTVYRATGEERAADKPRIVLSTLTGAQDARVIALSDECRINAEDENDTQLCTVVVAPNPARLIVFDENGQEVGRHRLSLSPGDLAGAGPADHVVPVLEATGAVYWFTGSTTIALAKTDLRPLWTIENAQGPGVAFAGRILVPVRDGLTVVDPTNGDQIGTIPVDRGDYRGVVTMATLGPMVYEQRGAELVALR